MEEILHILTCFYSYTVFYRLRIEYFGETLKNLSPEKHPNLIALKKRGCTVNLNYDTASVIKARAIRYALSIA